MNTTFETPENLSKLVNYGISFTAATQFLNWWTGTHFVNVFRNEYSARALNGNFNKKATSFSLNSQHTIKFGKTYTAEVSGSYYSGSVYGISTYKGNYIISTGIQRSLLKKAGILKLIVNDIFQSANYREETIFQHIDMRSDKRPDSRRVMLSFAYRFGKQEISKREEKQEVKKFSRELREVGSC